VEQSIAIEPLPDLYRTLQVDPSAHPSVIKAAFRTLMRTAHPDAGGDLAQAQSLTRAYSILSDSDYRRLYDETRRRTPPFQDPLGEIVRRLGFHLAQRLEPMGNVALARSFDLAGRLKGNPRHRIWLKLLKDSAPNRKVAFRILSEASRLTRARWQWGSDLFIVLVPRWDPKLTDLLAGPRGPWPRLASATLVLDIETGLMHYHGRTNELPAYRTVAQAFHDVMLSIRKA
jgi:hypothetical protein